MARSSPRAMAEAAAPAAAGLEEWRSAGPSSRRAGVARPKSRPKLGPRFYAVAQILRRKGCPRGPTGESVHGPAPGGPEIGAHLHLLHT